MTRKTLLLLAILSVLPAELALAFGNVSQGQALSPLLLADTAGNPVAVDFARSDRPTVVLFWASWSPRSAEALADFQSLHERLGPAALNLISVNVDHETFDAAALKQVVSMAREASVTYPVLIDRGLTAYADLGVKACPSAVLVSAKGLVLEALDGYPPSARERFLKAVAEAASRAECGACDRSSFGAAVSAALALRLDTPRGATFQR